MASKCPGVDVIGKLAESVVSDPVRPEIVTVEPDARSKLDINVTVSVFKAPDTGVLCWIDLTVKTGTCTRNGSAPCGTPCKVAPDFDIAVGEMDPTLLLLPSLIAAEILTDGDDWSDAEFLTVNVTVQDEPAANPSALDESMS